jgi:hypothetical protein
LRLVGVAHDGDISPVETGTTQGDIVSTNQPGKPLRVRGVEDADTEGHGVRVRGVEAAGTDSTEGHLAKVKLGEAGDDDGTEGHGVRVRI